MGRLSRRRFLGSGLAAGAFAALPASVYRNALLAADPPSERVRLGCVGVGNQGGPKNNLKPFVKNVVAVCDVDKDYLAAAAEFVGKATSAPKTTADYRTLLDAKDVDAVVVTTPDHWHAKMTIEACKAGKDVYVEKPLSLVIDEGKAMVEAARKYKRVVQTGTQQRSGPEFRKACELVRNGAVGAVKTVYVGLPKPNWTERAKKPVPDAPAPAGLDFDRWLGPAPERAYNANRVHYLFRFFWDYSGGQQTNFGAHHLDIAQWGLGMDESGPVAVEGAAKYHPEGWYETPDWTKITYTYANGVTLVCGQDFAQGAKFEGDKGSIFVARGKLEVKPKELEKHTGDVKLYVSNNHHQNFLDCVKTRKTPAADVAIGHRSATVCHLGNIAVRLGRKIKWDPAKEEIVGDAEAAKWLTKEYRKGYEIA